MATLFALLPLESQLDLPARLSASYKLVRVALIAADFDFATRRLRSSPPTTDKADHGIVLGSEVFRARYLPSQRRQ